MIATGPYKMKYFGGPLDGQEREHLAQYSQHEIWIEGMTYKYVANIYQTEMHYVGILEDDYVI